MPTIPQHPSQRSMPCSCGAPRRLIAGVYVCDEHCDTRRPGGPCDKWCRNCRTYTRALANR